MTAWPDTFNTPAPVDNNYRAALWLLGRHPRLADLMDRVPGVVSVEDGEPGIDLEHLAAVLNGVPAYNRAWEDYEAQHRAPSGDDDSEFYRWQEAGPKADDTVSGLAAFLVMSSGEKAMLRLLATLALDPAPFNVGMLRSFDAEGDRFLRDWCAALTAGAA